MSRDCFPVAPGLPSPAFLAALDTALFGKTKWYIDLSEARRNGRPLPKRSDYDSLGELKKGKKRTHRFVATADF